ncbi:hypothetical protein E2493_08615 [Sphingomonas parva]|uniref:Peptidase M56 domain-containing protein n=1 Tax=Sphingomonas parva TaxID=2555898 RepID=A0A4Y8ZRM0_9SPHN|nr:M56 family metallopeptidase [Sphingomonas parva]TFI58688.1 hypothetical protein E2493_08615 [Sphingomonas parva]
MIGWLVETLLTVTFLMLLVLVIRGPVTRMFGAGWAYALWTVPAARVALPPLPQLTPDIALPVAAFTPVATGSAAPLPADAGPGQWVPLMLAIWAGGAVIFMTLQWLASRDFVQRLRASARPARPPSYGGITTLVSQAAEGPLALGLVQRRIVLPSDFLLRYNVVERRLALEHELTHHRRGDIWWNMAATTLLALNWFNPIAWAAFRAFRADQELSCDAAVAARASAEERSDYARAMVKSASRPGLIGACALNSADALKLRLRMMRCHRVSGARRAGGVAALALFATAGFAVGKPEHVPAEAAALADFAAAAPQGLLIAQGPESRALTVAPALAAAPLRPARADARPVRRAKAHHARRSAVSQLVRLAAPVVPASPAVALVATVAPSPSVDPAPQFAEAAPPHRAIHVRRVIRIERERLADRLALGAPALQPAHELQEAIERVGEAVEGQGGAMTIEALARILEAKVELRGLQSRAPALWNDEGTIGECVK